MPASNEGAAFTSQWAEVSPAELKVDIYTRNDGSIAEIRAQNSVLDETKIAHLRRPLLSGTTAAAPYLYPPLAKAQAQKTRINPSLHTSIALMPHYFTLLDVGRWGGPAPSSKDSARDFGIIWGRYVALCEFVPKNAAYDTDQHLLLDNAGVPHQIPVNDVIRQLRSASYSVKLNKWVISRTPNHNSAWTPDGRVYVILPDLHLPVATERPPVLPAPSQPARRIMRGNADGNDVPTTSYELRQADGKHLERHGYLGDTLWFERGIGHPETGRTPPNDEGLITYQNGTRALGAAADRWFDRYIKGDIFGPQSGAAARDLEAFLDRLLTINLAAAWPLHFVQVGDMYDLWIGLERFFEDIPVARIGARAPDTDVVLKPPTANAMFATAFIDEWVRRTDQCFPTLIPRFNKVAADPRLTSWWLWGNHDCYFAAHTPSAIRKRTKEIRAGGVFIEHGQRADPNNRDGAAAGHTTTNDVFRFDALRSFDPNRRSYYTAAAAVAYAGTPDFGVYVMGHTHSAFLTHVGVQAHIGVTPP
jgi:hypothetical protein